MSLRSLAVPFLAAWSGTLAQTAPPKARIAPTFDALQIRAEELPKPWRLDPDLACASRQAAALLQDDVWSQLLPKPRRRGFQTLVSRNERGSVLYFDWGERIPDAVAEMLPKLLSGGDEKKRDEAKGDDEAKGGEPPEISARSGGLLVILSFPIDCAERNFVIDRLRTSFGMRLPRPNDAVLRPSMGPLFEAARHGGNVPAALDLATQRAKQLADSSFCALLEGELATIANDWPRAGRSFARALALDAATDPLPDDVSAWSARHGLGKALSAQKKYGDAIRELTLAAQVAADLRRKPDQARSLYDCACAQALSGRPDDALASLKQCIALDPKQKPEVAADEDFTSLRERPEFQALVK